MRILSECGKFLVEDEWVKSFDLRHVSLNHWKLVAAFGQEDADNPGYEDTRILAEGSREEVEEKLQEIMDRIGEVLEL